jgi:hypothetical protein
MIDENTDDIFHIISIDVVEVNPEIISKFKSEREFLGLSIDIMVEVASYITVALNILGPNGYWTRDQAAVGGNMVRLYKLFSAVLDQTVQGRRETSFIFLRLSFETIVSIRYLLQEYEPNLIDRYVKHSLDHERKLYRKIMDNIANRSGLVLPIEDRMIKSIEKEFRSSGVNIDDMPVRKELNWGGKNIYEKAEAVGLGEAYLAMFAGSSQNVHGAWGDLYGNHLTNDDEGNFTPNIDWGHCRPQLLYSLSLISLETAEQFALFMGGQEVADHFIPRLDDLRDRIIKADQAHEAYLAGKTWPEI